MAVASGTQAPLTPPKLLRVRVHAGAAHNRVERLGSNAYELWVKAPPEQGRANAAVLALLARAPELASRRLRIVKGLRSPSKIVSVL